MLYSRLLHSYSRSHYLRFSLLSRWRDNEDEIMRIHDENNRFFTIIYYMTFLIRFFIQFGFVRLSYRFTSYLRILVSTDSILWALFSTSDGNTIGWNSNLVANYSEKSNRMEGLVDKAPYFLIILLSHLSYLVFSDSLFCYLAFVFSSLLSHILMLVILFSWWWNNEIMR